MVPANPWAAGIRHAGACEARPPTRALRRCAHAPSAWCGERTARDSGSRMMSWFDMSMPWWMFVPRGVTVYIGVLVLVRLAGKVTLGDVSTFNIQMLIFLGSLM